MKGKHSSLIYNSTGFTLIELMIVVAIIAVVAAVSVGIYRPFIKRTVCTDVERGCQEAMLKAVQWVAEKNTVPPSNATSLGINLQPDVQDIIIGGGLTTSLEVNGTAVNNECPLGTKFVLVEDNARGTWK